jgi:hypothetical protein
LIETWICEVDVEVGDNFVAKIEQGLRESDVRLKDSPLMRSQLQGRPKASAYWGVLLELIVKAIPISLG